MHNLETQCDRADREVLGGGQLLLMSDNCEHLINEAAALARAIVDRCVAATLLAISREALMIEGAWKGS
jgi:predicted ATPase